MPRDDLLQFRRGPSAQWSAANPVLLSGEVGYDTDLDQIRVGDGSLAWTDLPPLGLSILGLLNTFVRFVDQNGAPLPLGAVTTIHVNTITGDIDDITFEEV